MVSWPRFDQTNAENCHCGDPILHDNRYYSHLPIADYCIGSWTSVIPLERFVYTENILTCDDNTSCGP